MSTTESFNPDDYVAGPDGQLVEKQEQMGAKWRRDLEKRAKRGDEAVAKLEAMERRMAIRDAGIPNSKLGELFLKAYDGPIDDIEAIKAAAVDYGVMQASPEQQAQTQASLAGHQAAMEASAGAQATTGNEDLMGLFNEIKAKYPRGGDQAAAEVMRLMDERGFVPTGHNGRPISEDLR